jgi:hypothetical protein
VTLVLDHERELRRGGRFRLRRNGRAVDRNEIGAKQRRERHLSYLW